MPISIAPRIYLAPLQGYTNVFYRAALHATSSGIEKFFTPFFEEGKAHWVDPYLLPELDATINESVKLVPQIATNNSVFAIKAAIEFSDMGFKEMNINMGCPFPMLVKRSKGGGLLKEPNLIESIFCDLQKAAISIDVSVKMRAGFDCLAQGLTVIDVLNRFPLKEIIIHPRLVTQKYLGEPDWDGFEVLLNQSIHPVIGNGDITSLEEWKVLSDRFKSVNGWMIGRGLLKNPFLANQIVKGLNQPSMLEIFSFHQQYFNLVTTHFSDWYRAFNYLYAFWKYPLEGFENGSRFYRKLKKHNTPNSYNEWVYSLKAHYTLN